MKFSVALAILILAAAVGLGWQDHQRLVTFRALHANWVAAAARLGISLNPADPAAAVHITKRERNNSKVDAKVLAIELIASAQEMEAIRKEGGKPDEATEKRFSNVYERMTALDFAGLTILIAEVRAAKDLAVEMRQRLVSIAIRTLSSEHPQATLALFTESPDFFKDDGMSSSEISSLLARRAKDDPLAALEWVRKNSAKFPDLITESAKTGVIYGAAVHDPKLAFKLIGELGIKKAGSVVSEILSTVRTPEERSSILTAVRDHLADLPDEKARKEFYDDALRTMARGVSIEGFESGSRWLAAANLTSAELETFVRGLDVYDTKGDTGQWVEWIGEKLPTEKGDAKIDDLVSDWAKNDYQAAGKWLGSTPDGPTKNAAIRSYAVAISTYAPETAAQWAMTLPPGKYRDGTLGRILNNWPQNDPADKEAAAAFAKEHGIK